MAPKTVPSSKTKPYIGYVRRSQDNGSGVSEEQQRAAITGWAALNGHEVKFLPPDLDESGKNLKRPSMTKAREMVNAGKAAGIVAAKLDRITRNVGDLMGLLREAKDGDWNLVACDLGLDLSTKNGKLVATQLGAVAEWILDNQTEGLNESRRGAVRNGVHGSTTPPYGYEFSTRGVRRDGKKQRGKLVIVPEEAAKVREAFEARADNHSWREVMNILGKKTQSAASNIIKNEVYRGVASSGDERHEGAHEAIIDPVLWRRANAVQKVRPPSYGKSGHEWMLGGGILRCAACGGTLVGDISLHAYRCKTLGCTEKVSVKASAVEPVVLELARGWHERLQPDYAVLRSADDALLPALEDERNGVLAERAAVEASDALSALRKAEALTKLDERLARIDTEISSAEAGMGALSFSPQRMAEKLAKAEVREKRSFVKEMVQVWVTRCGPGSRAPVEARLKTQYLDAGRTAGGVPAEQWPKTVEVERDLASMLPSKRSPLVKRDTSKPLTVDDPSYAKAHKALRAS